MHAPDIEKLRRFSLTIALVLLTYSIAGLSMVPNSAISFTGMTFTVSRPGWLPVGVVVASFYAMTSFYYYGFMLRKSPYRVRRDIIDGLNSWEPNFTQGSKVPVYVGPTEFETTPWYANRQIMEDYVKSFPEAFPKFARARVKVQVISRQSYDENGEEYMVHAAKVIIPKRCRLAAIYQDCDYSSPIWMNVIALVSFFFPKFL